MLTRPYGSESRVVVTVVAWDALKRAASSLTERLPEQWHAACGMSTDDATRRSDSTIKEVAHEQWGPKLRSRDDPR